MLTTDLNYLLAISKAGIMIFSRRSPDHRERERKINAQWQGTSISLVVLTLDTSFWSASRQTQGTETLKKGKVL